MLFLLFISVYHFFSHGTIVAPMFLVPLSNRRITNVFMMMMMMHRIQIDKQTVIKMVTDISVRQ